ncbi:MAG: motif family protein [Acidobacteria bacterium]|nr:motif family protein [Acidobacteriota bacterium]
MKKFLITTLAATTIITAAFADAGEFGHRGQRREMRREAVQRLNLSDAQKAQIRDIRKAEFDRTKGLFEAAREKRFELRQLKEANDPRAEGVRTELIAMREQMRAARLATREKIRSVLTAEQRAQMDDMRNQRRGNRE